MESKQAVPEGDWLMGYDDHLSDEEKKELHEEQVKAKAFLEENYESRDLLDGIEYLDNIRTHIADQDNFKPPEIRVELLKLHKKVQDFLYYKSKPEDLDPIWEMAEDIETDLYTIGFH